MLDVNQKVPLSSITNPITRYAKRANTPAEKHCLFEITEAVGTAISEQHDGFNTKEFMTACGVNPDWAKVAA